MKEYIAIALCLCLLAGMLTGCGPAESYEAYIPTGDALEAENPDVSTKPQTDQEQSLSLAYYPKQSTNPYLAADCTNRMILPLVYQGLFTINRNYEVEPVLCKSYTVSADLMTYEFTIDPNATFSDGTQVTAEDVNASLRKAINEKYYGGRARHMQKISVTEAGTLMIKLNQAYENLPMLLDIPIVKAEEVEADFPLGTGPYVYRGTDANRKLARRTNWWCQSDDLLITAQEIPLVACETITQVRDEFEFADVGIVCTDPGSDWYVQYRCDYELWDCESGIFVYLGVNADSSVFRSQELRQALSKGINRDYLVDNYYRGFAVSAELPASPWSPYYTPALAQQYGYDPQTYVSIMSSAQGRTIRLLVNSDDSLRMRVAQEIGRMLNTAGLIVEVVGKPTSEYKEILKEGEYDLYLGQTKLSPNMDLTHFFSEGGNLNYGGMDHLATYTLCLKALENQGNYYTLHQTVMDEGYLCPILFRSYAVYATRGLLTQLTPARDNLFCYSIGKSMTEAYKLQ